MLSNHMTPFPRPHAANHRSLWKLQPSIAYLNHGSFGATPIAILEEQRKWQDRMEAEPVQFMVRTLPEALWNSQVALGKFISADPADIALIDNATGGVNTIFASLDLQPGDEILFVDQVYGACKKTAELYAKKARAVCVVVDIPNPIDDPQEIVRRVCAAWTPKTKLVLLDHICSPTGWILPAEEIVAFYESKGVEVLVDGAHVLGQIPLNIEKLGASYYVANAHKWLCTPKGSAFLHVRRDKQHKIRPQTISHWIDWQNTTDNPQHSNFQMSFSWTGTKDASATLSIPFALEWMSQLHPNGWSGLQEENTTRARSFRRDLIALCQVETLCPNSMVGHMGSVLLPKNITIPPTANIPLGQGQSPLWDWFYREHGIEVVVFPVLDRHMLRFSIQSYVSDNDLNRLYTAISSILPA